MLSSESEDYPEWKALLTEVLADIAKRLTSIADYTSFRGVCGSWRCAATFDNFDREFHRAPRLLYFLKETDEEEDEEAPVLGDAFSEVSEEETIIYEKIVTKFLDLESNTSKIANFPPPIFHPDKYLSCSGWILVSDETEVCLKHFMLGISIKLPLLNILFITKMVLSGSPIMEESGVVVMVIWGYDDQLAFCRPGDEYWTVMDWWEDGIFYDIIYHDRKLYALDSSFRIVECDIHSSNPTKIVEVFAFPPDDMFTKIKKFGGVGQQFLVESFGKFLLVAQCMPEYFRVYEIELKDGCRSYEEIDNIGDRVLFLGLNSSICVASSRVKLDPNSIYLSKSKSSSWELHVGVYTLGDDGDGCFKDFSGMFDFRFPPPVWVVPSI